MSHALRIVLGLILLLSCRSAVPAADEFPFHEGERVMFLGDSITEQYQYSTYLELYLATRFPKWKLSFMNAGIGGDTATGGARRFQEQVLNEKPTIVTINFGMNDGGYGGFDVNRHKPYVENTKKMLEMARDAHVRAVLISPNAVDWRGRPRFEKYLETQHQFYAPLKDIAEANDVPFVDQYASTRSTLEQLVADKADGVQPFPDGVHTSPAGGLLMAHAILTGLDAPAVVSDAAIPEKGEVKTVRCTVSDVKRNGNTVSFDRLDEDLPMPVLPDWEPILPYVDNLSDLNRYGLEVAGLEPGRYSIAIDGVEIAQHTAVELAEGVNLGNVRVGPLFEQGMKVFHAINQKNGTVHGRFRGVILAPIPDWLADVAAERKPKELAKRKELIDKQQAEVQKLAMPARHRWEIKPVK